MGLLKNGLRIFLFVILLLCNVQEGLAQFKFRTLTVIIDTVVVLNPKEILNEIYVYATHQKSDLPYENNPYDTGYSKYRYPNYINSFKIYEKLFDSSKINIPIDEDGSYLYIHNLFNLFSDTLRLDKLVLWSNCYPDTTYFSQWFYKRTSDSTWGEPFKTKYKRIIKRKRCEKPPPENTTYIVNNKKYEVQIIKSPVPQITIQSGHGTKPRRYYKDPGKFKGKITRMSSYSRTRVYHNFIDLYLEPPVR